MRVKLAIALCGALVLAGCSSTAKNSGAPDVSAMASARGYKVGKPYSIKGVRYYPQVEYDYVEEGVASWYGPGFDGRSTANGETYDMNDLTAAHRTLPMPSIVRVTNLENGRSLKLKVNDRGPFARDRIIDVSRRASQLLGFHVQGTTRVRVEIVEDESRMLAAALGVPSEVAWAAGRSAAPAVPAAEVAPVVPVEVAEVPVAPVEVAPMQVAPMQVAPVEVAELTAPPIAVPGAGVEVGATPPGIDPSPVADPATDYASSYPPATVYEPAPYVASSTASPPAAPATARAAPVAGAVGGAAARWIQAGAFADPGRAAAARRRLSGLGPTEAATSIVRGRELVRVRVGPFTSQEEAQRTLASVARAGFQDSRIVSE